MDSKAFFAYLNTDLINAHTPNLWAARGECVQFALIGAPVFVQVFGPWSKRPEGEGPELCASPAAHLKLENNCQCRAAEIESNILISVTNQPQLQGEVKTGHRGTTV